MNPQFPTFWNELYKARFALWNGFLNTIELSIFVIIIGTFIGLIGGLILLYMPRPLRWVWRGYVHVARGLPVLVLILFTYYGLSLAGLNISPFAAGIVALSAFCGAHMSETIRGAISSIPVGQTDAGKAIGLTFWQRLVYVILPQAVRRILPPWVNTAVELIKGSTLLLVIGVVEFLLATQQTIARNYLVLEFYGFSLMVYVILCFAVSQAGALLERRFAYLKY
jgi:polar amino acid transport system permease protein